MNGSNGMIAICREVCKNTGEITVYPIEAEATDKLLFCLQIRARANPELRYFIVSCTTWENDKFRSGIDRLLRRKDVTPRAINAHGGILEL